MTTEKRELTQEEIKKIAMIIADGIVKLERDMINKMMRKAQYDIFTPFFIKWYHKLKNERPWEDENL